MAKTHSLIVRGVTKSVKNSLKRMALANSPKLSVNQVMLKMLSNHTESEILEFNGRKYQSQPISRETFEHT